MLKALLHVLTGGLLLGLFACGAPSEHACTADADCASGTCDASGVCAAPGDHDPFGADGGDSDASGGDGDEGAGDASDGDATADTDGGDAPPPGDDGLCHPNYDGALSRDEIFFAPGLTAPFSIARDVTFDTAGTTANDGQRVWDFRPALAGQARVERGFTSLEDVWFHDPADAADPYAGATHAIETFGDDDYLGVYEATPEQLLLRGIVSVADGTYSTQLAYDPPLVTLDFPFAEGDAWESATTVSGWLSGAYSLYWEDASLEVTVDAAGTAVTEFASFPVLRVRTRLTRQTGVYPPTVRRTFAWVTECFGTIAWAMSHDDEDTVEFTAAAEVGRLVP